ncbi:hypothetical protein MMC10_002204 [Thelotrema lepadinum]|nr:hypothetical protein [Thelotrema lepadinum]
MADGLNDARAMRIAEVMTHFQTICQQIAQYRVTPPPGQAQAGGFVMLNQCHAQAQAVLALPFNPGPAPGGANVEQIRAQLRGILLDAASRRFRAHKIYLRTLACMRWVQRRTQVLHGQPPNASNAAALTQLNNTLNTELTAVTDQRVFNELSARDNNACNWMAEMPTLQMIRVYIQSH